MWLTIVQTFIFTLYTVFLWWRFKGPLPSYSDSWYRLQDPWNSLFWVFCTSLGVTMCFQGSGNTAWFFLSGSALCFVGVASAFKMEDKMIGIIHVAGATSSIMLGFLGLIIEFHMAWPVIIWGGISIVLSIFKVRNKTWWVELLAFVFIISGLYSVANG